MNKTKIALAVLLLAGTASASLASEVARNQAYTPRTFQSAPVRLHQAPAQQQFYVPQAPLDRDLLPHAGGVG
jgi:hypothetical protein